MTHTPQEGIDFEIARIEREIKRGESRLSDTLHELDAIHIRVSYERTMIFYLQRELLNYRTIQQKKAS